MGEEESKVNNDEEERETMSKRNGEVWKKHCFHRIAILYGWGMSLDNYVTFEINILKKLIFSGTTIFHWFVFNRQFKENANVGHSYETITN